LRVRICRSEIGELAHQAESVQILAKGEIPVCPGAFTAGEFLESHPASRAAGSPRWVRIRRSEIGELAHQAKSVQILTAGEILTWFWVFIFYTSRFLFRLSAGSGEHRSGENRVHSE